MKVAIDGGCLANRRGFGRFARGLLAALAELPSPHEYVLFLDAPSRDIVEVPDRYRVVTVGVSRAPSRAASARGRRSVSDLLRMGRAVAREAPDVMFFPATYSAFPVWGCGRTIVTLHDTLALEHPELVFPTRMGRWAWALKEYAAVSRADRVLTVSEASKRALMAWFRLPGERVGVVSEAPHAVFRPTTMGSASDEALRRHGVEPGSRFLLYVGGLGPHKNLPRLVEAFALADLRDTFLVLVGDHADVFHAELGRVRVTIGRLGLNDRVLLPGFVPDEDLVYLYGRAWALVQPSLMEGFGLPPLEAMACGTPVLSSRAGSLPEVVGGAGLFFEPADVDEIAGALRRIVRDDQGRVELARRALGRASHFTWERAARTLLHEFDALLECGGSPPLFRTWGEGKRRRAAALHKGPRHATP
jgi:glycosyltransferase involved in cell wall biosynthesis